MDKSLGREIGRFYYDGQLQRCLCVPTRSLRSEPIRHDEPRKDSRTIMCKTKNRLMSVKNNQRSYLVLLYLQRRFHFDMIAFVYRNS